MTLKETSCITYFSTSCLIEIDVNVTVRTLAGFNQTAV